MKKMSLLPLVCLCFIVASCVSTVPEKKINYKTRNPIRLYYPKLKNYKLAIYPIGKHKFKAGQDATLLLCVKNLNDKEIRIDEWYMNEPENVRLYYHPFEEQLRDFNPKEWTCIEPEIKQPPQHFPLILMPGNSAIVHLELPFVKKLEPGKPRRFLVVAELALKSVQTRSSMFPLAVE